MGFKTYDVLHIACAEKAVADVLLSTDVIEKSGARSEKRGRIN